MSFTIFISFLSYVEIETSTSGSLARSTRISSSNYLNQNVNILLIAEKGVGKSTFINALVNYLSFGTVEQAQMHDPIVLKPLSFFMATNEPYQEHIVTFGNFVQQNSSVTQRCETYKFDLAQNNGKKLCLIDTPSLDDATSNENIRHMIDYVTKLTHLNAICFLLQPDASQLMTSFQSCFGQLMNHLGQHAQQNIIFCFTNALMGISVPGKTASLLRNMFRSHSMNDIPFSKDNTFIFENESFRYLMAIENGIRFNNEDIAEYTMSWPDSVNEAKRLLDYLLRRPLFYIRK